MPHSWPGLALSGTAPEITGMIGWQRITYHRWEEALDPCCRWWGLRNGWSIEGDPGGSSRPVMMTLGPDYNTASNTPGTWGSSQPHRGREEAPLCSWWNHSCWRGVSFWRAKPHLAISVWLVLWMLQECVLRTSAVSGHQGSPWAINLDSSHLILCHLLLLLSSIFPSLRVFSNELALHNRWPKYQSFNFDPSNEFSELIAFRIDWFDLLDVQRTLKSLLQHHNLKVSILWYHHFMANIS